MALVSALPSLSAAGSEYPAQHLSGGRVLARLTVTCIVVLVGLLAKGAIAAFYLRERGSYSEDGAAYITAQDEPP